MNIILGIPQGPNGEPYPPGSGGSGNPKPEPKPGK